MKMKKPFKQLLWFIIPLAVCIGAFILIFLIPEIQGPSSLPRFIGAKKYLGLMPDDKLMHIALFNTYQFVSLALTFGIILGSIFTKLTGKLNKSINYTLVIASSIIFVGLIFANFLFGMVSIYTAIALTTFFIYPCFYISNKLINIYTKNAVEYGGIILVIFILKQVNLIYVQLVGIPAKHYAANTMVTHIQDYSSVRTDLSFDLFGNMITLIFCIIICFVYWLAEKVFNSFRRRKDCE